MRGNKQFSSIELIYSYLLDQSKSRLSDKSETKVTLLQLLKKKFLKFFRFVICNFSYPHI